MSRSSRVSWFLIYASTTASIFFILLLIPLISIFLFFKPRIAGEVFLSEEFASEVWEAILVTLEASALSTLVLALLAIPTAYILARKDFRGKSMIESVLDIPLVVPHTVAGIMVLTAFGKRGLLGPLTARLGVAVNDSFWGIFMAMLFVSSPIMVEVVKAGFLDVDPMLEAVSRSLGASLGKTFLKITLPLSWRSILAGVVLSWARALSEVGAILVVAYFPKSVNVLILEFLNSFGLSYAVALAVPFLLGVLALFIVLRLLAGRSYL